MQMLDISRFQDADKYAAYLKMLPGQAAFRAGLGERAPLPDHNASKVRALDVSGGTGFASVQLALMVYEFVLLDGSEEVLGMARQQVKGASEAGLQMRLEFAAIALYIETVTRRSCASSSEATGP
jgi:2-polyprenyl-3-methyl-5-hydroxy-6-metoxy-1,4-benzoquinol methylase